MNAVTDYTYQQIRADVFNQVRGMEPGTYWGEETEVKILKITDMYLVKLTLKFHSWTFFFVAADYEGVPAV